MYRCKDCGLEYKEKAEYCECGNNTFEFIEEVVPHHSVKLKRKPLTLEQKSEIISRFFLMFCIIFSIIVWLIPVKVPQAQEAKNIVSKPLTSIPSIDKIWDNTPVREEKKEVVIINTTPIPLTAIPDYAKPKTLQQNKNIQQPKKVEQKKIDTQKTSSNKYEAPKTNKTSTPKTTQQTNTSQKNLSQNKTEKVQTQKTEQPKRIEQSQKVEQPKKIEQPKPAYNPNSPEMLKYKGGLRAAMFSKFPVGSISGSGNCSVHFSVDSTGKLINRGFSKQSDNKSLNDAVYYMMMSVPKFSPPPSGYNGETIRMNFKINNGEYEISIY